MIAPHRRHVNLGLADGAALPDPHGLLQGTGRRHRHVRIASEADLAHPGVRALLEAAAARVGGSSS